MISRIPQQQLSAAHHVRGPRHPSPVSHPVLVGPRKYLRALRAAEMAAWEAGTLWPTPQAPLKQGSARL